MSVKIDRVLSDGRVLICKDGVYLSLTPEDANQLANLLIGYLMDSDTKWINFTSTQLDEMLKDDNAVE